MASNGIKPQVFNSAFTLIKLTLISLPKYRLNTTCKRLVVRLLYTSKNLRKKQYNSKHQLYIKKYHAKFKKKKKEESTIYRMTI